MEWSFVVWPNCTNVFYLVSSDLKGQVESTTISNERSQRPAQKVIKEERARAIRKRSG